MSAFRYAKASRVRTKLEYRAVLKHGDVFPGRECLVRRLPNGRAGARLGISVPGKYGGAIRRNRLRRLIREAFRHVQADLGAHDFLVSPRKQLTEPTLGGIRDDLVSVLHRKPVGKRR